MRDKKTGRFLPYVARPWSIGKCPTADELRRAWRQRKTSQADFIALLSLLGELTCFTDCNLIQKGGFANIAGRAGGLKAFLARETPELLPKYKSISRHATLATRIKMAFAIYPPAALSLMHPDLPLPARNMPFLTNHCRKVYRDHFVAAKPTYVAFKAIADKRLVRHPPRVPWGPPLPQKDWKSAENDWRLMVLRPIALETIKADHSFYARDHNRFMGKKAPGPFD